MSKTFDNRRLDDPCPRAEVTDEEIMAYVDGVLPHERLPAVREAIAGDPERMRTMEIYLETGRPMARALDAALDVPDSLLAGIRNATPAALRARGLGALLRAAAGGHLFAKLRVPMLAVAAIFLVLLGAWLGDYAMRHSNPTPARSELVRWEPRGLVVADPWLQRALEATPSGEEARLADRLSARLVATFRTRAGTLCREFDLLRDGRPGARSLACRGSDGAWLVPAPGMLRPKEYGVAGGPAQGQQQPIDEDKAMLESLKQGLLADAVSPDKERDLIKGRWREAN
jgi:anti-sigma factor RsiW